MDAAGKDDVLIETVGVGQAEIDIVDHADTIMLALMPGSGDSIQALKAGVMEIPDIIVVNKADHPMTDTMVREVRGVLALSHDPEGWKVPILRTEAARGEGVEELAAPDRRAPRLHRGGGDAGRAPRPQPAQRGARDRDLADAAPARATVAEDPETAELLERVVRRELDPASAAGRAAGAARRWLSAMPLARRGDRLGRRPAGRPRAASGVGEVQSVYIDSTSHQPAWLVAKLAAPAGANAARASSPCRSTSAPAPPGSGSGSPIDGEPPARRPRRRPDPAAAARARADDLRALRDRRERSAAPPKSPSRARRPRSPRAARVSEPRAARTERLSRGRQLLVRKPWKASDPMALLIIFGFVAGAATAVSPCVLPVLPIALSAGATGGRRRPLGIVAGLAVSFTFATRRAGLRDRRARPAQRPPAQAGDRRPARLRHRPPDPAAGRPARGLAQRLRRPGRRRRNGGDGFWSGIGGRRSASASSTRPAPGRSSPA